MKTKLRNESTWWKMLLTSSVNRKVNSKGESRGVLMHDFSMDTDAMFTCQNYSGVFNFSIFFWLIPTL